ncbi:MAG: TetR/AcrR family transcriptional regulator, partial [Dietzia sp.]|nr:TetR/AcrR family transcriptional regulator [Dietzia sp.]
RIVAWCREHPVEAQVLLAGPDALAMVDWPEVLVGRRKRVQRKLRKALAEIPDDAGRVSAALIDVPYAIVRRHLRARQTIPVSADAIVADCARALIAPS